MKRCVCYEGDNNCDFAHKKGLHKQAFAHVGMPPRVPCSRHWKETPYFQSGQPLRLSERPVKQACSIRPDLASHGDIIGSSQSVPLSRTSQGSTRIFNYTIISAKTQEINKTKSFLHSKKRIFVHRIYHRTNG